MKKSNRLGGLIPFENINLVYKDDFDKYSPYFQKTILHDENTFPISDITEIDVDKVNIIKNLCKTIPIPKKINRRDELKRILRILEENNIEVIKLERPEFSSKDTFFWCGDSNRYRAKQGIMAFDYKQKKYLCFLFIFDDIDYYVANIGKVEN